MLISNHKLPDYIHSIVTDGPDCIGDGSEYIRLLGEINEISECLISLDNIQCAFQDNQWKLSFDNFKQGHKISLPHSEYFDPKVIEFLNSLINANQPKESRYLFTLEGGPYYDFGICLSTLENEIKLAEANIIWRSDAWKQTQTKLDTIQSTSATAKDYKALELWTGHIKATNNEEITLFKLIVTHKEGTSFSGQIYEGNDFDKAQNNTIAVSGVIEGDNINFDKSYGEAYYKNLVARFEMLGMPVDDSYQAPTEVHVLKHNGKITNNTIAKGTWSTKGTDGKFYGSNINDPNSGTWEMKRES